MLRALPAVDTGRRSDEPAERGGLLDRLVSAAVVRGAIAGAAASALLILNVDLFLGAALRRDLRLAIGAVLLAIGIPLAASTRARRALVHRLIGSSDARPSRRHRAKQRLAGWLVPLVAVVWVAAGLFELIRATVAGGG